MEENNVVEKVINMGINWKSIFISLLVGLLIGIIGTGYVAHKYYEPKLDALNGIVNDYTARYSDIIDQKEAAIIAKAKAEEKANTPVKEYIQGETKTIVQVVEKKVPSDADVKQTFKNDMQYEYNGVKYPIKMQTQDGSQIKDGQLVIDQKNSAVLNVDDIVNRQIANTIMKKDAEIEKLKTEKVQGTFWGTVAGYGIARITSK